MEVDGGCKRGPDGYSLSTAKGNSFHADQVVLATGNFPPGKPKGIPASFMDSPLYFQNPWNIGTRTIYANSTHFYSGSGNTLQASTQGIVRKWEFAGKAGFSELSTTGYSDVSALTRPDGTKIVDKVYVAVTNDKNELLWSTTGSRVRSVATNFKNNYYVDKINKDVNNKYIWWANHISGLTTSNTAGALIDSTQSLPFHSFLGRGSDVVTENSVTLATLMDGYDKFADKTTIDIDVISIEVTNNCQYRFIS